MALGKASEKTGQSSVERTWMGNLEMAAEISGYPQFREALTVVPKGNKLPKITSLGFTALRDIGQYCDRRRLVLDENGQPVMDGEAPVTERNADAMTVPDYAMNRLKPLLDEVYGTEEAPHVEAEIYDEDGVYRPTKLSRDTSALTQFRQRDQASLGNVEKTLALAQRLSLAAEMRADDAHDERQMGAAKFYRLSQRLDTQLEELVAAASAQAEQDGRNMGQALVHAMQGKSRQAAIEEIARFMEGQSSGDES
jgi:hypothetical protein